MKEVLFQKKEGLSALAYKEIKSMVLANVLKPADIFSEAQLQEMLKIGRTPVREAVLQLSQEGFLIVHPRRGIEVARISPKRIKDIFEIRSLMEPEILRIGFSKIDRERLYEIRDEFLSYKGSDFNLTKSDTLHLSDLDNELHMTIVNSISNDYATELMISFNDYLTLFRASTTIENIRFEPSNLEHIAIIESILKDDVEEAALRLTDHLDESYKESIKIVMNIAT